MIRSNTKEIPVLNIEERIVADLQMTDLLKLLIDEADP